MAMEFKGKDEYFVTEWLTKQGFKATVVDAFVRKKLWQCQQTKLILLFTRDVYLENEVDGDAFLLLSEKQIKELIKAVGPQVKFSQKHKVLCTSLSDKDKVAISDHNVV